MRHLPSLLLLAAAAAAHDRTNVVLLVADDLGWKDLGCTGSEFYETPNLDRLAADGARFSTAYAACPVCSPTRVALMTGKAPARLDTTDYFGGRRAGKLLPAPYERNLPADEVTLAEAFREAGYRTGFFGKWHLGDLGSYPEDHGFEHNAGGFERGMPPKGYFSPYGNPRLADGPEGEHLTERLTREAVGWMDSVKDEPFLLVFCYYTVHTPLQSKPEYAERFRAKKQAAPADGPAWGQERKRKVRLVQDHAVYAGMVQSLDESVGLVLGALESHGLSDQTLVMFTSDNGGLSTSEGHPTSNMPLRAGKGWAYEGGVRVPAIVRWPGVTTPGVVLEDPMWSADGYPTARAAAGLDARPTQHVDGLALTPALSGGALPKRALYWHYPHYGNQGAAPCGAVRWGDWKLVEWFEDDRLELFDLAADEGETTDLAAAHPERAAQLHGLLRDWRERTGANMPTPNPNHGK